MIWEYNPLGGKGFCCTSKFLHSKFCHACPWGKRKCDIHATFRIHHTMTCHKSIPLKMIQHERQLRLKKFMYGQSLVIGGRGREVLRDDTINTITASARYCRNISRSLDSQQWYSTTRTVRLVLYYVRYISWNESARGSMRFQFICCAVASSGFVDGFHPMSASSFISTRREVRRMFPGAADRDERAHFQESSGIYRASRSFLTVTAFISYFLD